MSRYPGLGRRCAIAKRAVRPHVVVLPAPALDQHLGFLQGVEDLAVQHLVSQLSIEGLVVAVLPRAPRLDEQRLSAHPSDPLTHGSCRELASVVGADVAGAVLRSSGPPAVDHVADRSRRSTSHCQAATRVLVDHRQHPELAAVVCTVESRSRSSTRGSGYSAVRRTQEPSFSQSRRSLGLLLRAPSGPPGARSARSACDSRASPRGEAGPSPVGSRSGRTSRPTRSCASSGDTRTRPPRAQFCCVERGWPSVLQARRSDTPRASWTLFTAKRRRWGLRSFPPQPHGGSRCPVPCRPRSS